MSLYGDDVTLFETKLEAFDFKLTISLSKSLQIKFHVVFIGF